MRFTLVSGTGTYGQTFSLVDTARGEVLLPHNYSPVEAEYLCGMLNATCRAVPRAPREPARPALRVVASHGLTVIQGGRTA